MSDTTLNRIVSSVADAAARAAFTPSPPTPPSGPAQGYTLYQRDTDTLYSWDSGSGTWVAPTGGTVNLATGVTGTLPVANGGTGVYAGFVPMLKATASLTNAQILAGPTTPITLIAAPSAGTRIKILGASYRSNFVSIYTNINATYAACALYYLGNFTQWAQTGVVDDAGVSLTRFSDMFGTTNTTVIDTAPYLDAPGNSWVVPNNTALSFVDGVALAWKIDNNGSGNLTGGNAANTLKITTYYCLEAL